MAHLTVDLSDAELLARMKNFEDHLVERKTISDQKDWRKTVVAFANSAPVGLPAVLYIGVRNNGEIETPQHDLDSTQRTFNRLMQDVYPRVPYVPKIVTENGRQALAVIIPGSESRPHFAGLSYVRRGSETFEASEEQFAELVAQRNSKAALILQSKGKNVTVITHPLFGQMPEIGVMGGRWPDTTVIVNCDQFYVTLLASPTDVPESFPLGRVEVNRDNLRSRLQLEIHG